MRQNINTRVTLDLSDVRFTKGVDFDFSAGSITSLAPGEFVLVVSNIAAFEMRYGTGLPVAGIWDITQSLGNGGEQLKLSLGADLPPQPAGGAPQVTTVVEGEESYAAIRFRRRPSADLAFTVESSADLEFRTADATAPHSVSDNGDGTETVTVRALRPHSGDRKQDLRLRVKVQ